MSKPIPPKIVQRIKSLRQRGWSLPEIRKKTKVGYGTIYRYIKDVKILPKYQKIWLGKWGGSIKRKKLAEQKAKRNAKRLITSLSRKEKLIFLSALYWGEGTKAEFGLSNTDPNLIRVFVKGLEQILGISKDRFGLSVRIYEDLDKEKCLKFWSHITGIPVNKFVSVNVLKGKKAGKLPYGMCRIRIKKGGDVLKYMVALKNEIIQAF